MIPLRRFWFYVLMLVTLAATAFTADAQVKADFTAKPITGCAPMHVQFEDASTGQDLLYYWDLGNGTNVPTNNPRPSTTYFNPGKYTIKLVVKNADGIDSITRTEYIVVNAPPVVSFSALDTTGCYPLVVGFREFSTAGSGTIISYEWDFGDGTLSTEQNPVHTYTTSGSFTVSLRVFNSNGCVKVFTKPSYIKTDFGVKADFSYVSGAGCSSPTPVTFTNKSSGTGASTYKWFFGDGGTSTETNPVHNYTTNGAYTLTLIATNSSGCADTLVKPNAINIGFVKPDFTYPQNVCAGKNFTIQNTSAPNTVASKWYFSDGTTSTVINPNKSFSSPGTYTIKLVNDFGSCKDSIVKSITIIPKPSATVNIANSTGCILPHTANFQSTSSNAVSYLWDFGDSTSSTLSNPSHIYTKFGSYNIKLIVTNATGCTDTINMVEGVKVFRPKITSFENLPARGCIPYNVSPTAVINTAQPITSYLWDFGDGSTSTSATPTHTYTVAGKYNVKLIVTTATGCADTLSMTQAVLVGTKPVPNFEGSPREVCPEYPVYFKDLTPGINHEWFWQFGDGGTSIEQNPRYNYNDTGYFNVKLTVTNFGCSDSIKINSYIHVLPPIARFDTVVTCSNRLTRTFIDKSVGATTWLWQFGDGTTSTLQNPPPHTYAAPGLYTVILRVGNGLCEHSQTTKIKVVNESGKFTTDPSPACTFTRIKMDVTGVNASNISNYTWFFDGFDGPQVHTTNAPVSQTYAQPGVYYVGVVLTDVYGCKDTLKGSIPLVINGAKADFLSPFAGTCAATTVNFIDSSKADGRNAIKEWAWDFGDGKKQTFTTPPFSHAYDTTGVFDVTLKIVDEFGCRDSVTKKAVIAISKPIASYTISDTILCPGSPLVITNASKGLEVKYLWDFGDGNTSTEYSPTHLYTKEGSFEVKMKMIDKYGCSDSISYHVKVYLPKADYLMSGSFSTCPPLLVDFTNQSKNFTSYSWDFGDGGFSNLQDPKHNYTYPGTYTVSLSVKNNGGCTDTLKKTVVIQGPSGVFKYVPTAICNPGNINFSATTTNTVNYIWDFNDGSTSSSSQPASSHVYTTPGKFIPRMILQDASGCQVPVVGTDTIKVNTIETEIFAKNRVVCDSGSVAFFDSTKTNDAIGTFKWEFGDGSSSVERNPVHVYKNPGWYTIKMIATSAFGCTDTAVIKDYIKVSNKAVIAITGDTSACEPAILTFKGAVVIPDTSALKWSWTFGNGQVSTLQDPPPQIYQNAGSYPLAASVTNSDGCTTDVTRTVNIRPKPVVDAGPDIVACRNTPVTLKASGAVTYVWDAHPSLSCTSCESPVANPQVTTTYRVTGKTIFGCTSIDSVTVKVTQPVNMQVGNGDTLCLGSSFKLNASGADQYQWSPSSYLDNAFSATPSAKPDTTITYRVIGKDSNNCFADTGYVTLHVRPLEVLILGDTSACEPANLTFRGNSLNNDSSPLSWNWDFGNGVKSTAQNPAIQNYQKAGSYNIKVTVVNANGCMGTRETVAQINPLPKVDAGADTLICKFSDVTLRATGADSYTWDFKPSLNCLNCASPVASPDSATTYAVTGRNLFGCTSRDSLTIRVNRPFDMRVGDGDSLCVGENCVLWASGAQLYQWTPSTFLDKPFAASTRATPNSTITYQVIGKDSIGCFSDTGRITVQVFPKPHIDIIGGVAINLSVGGRITLDTKNTPDIIKWVWTPATGLSCTTCPNPVATPVETTTYSVTASNIGGCVSTDDVRITVICNDGSIYIPNTFSPNADGSNDVFYPRSSANFSIKSFRVFNRWGQMMYQRENFSSNSAADGWDGTFNGVKLTPDVYVYSMEVICGTGAVIPVKGNITLIK